MLKTIYDHFVVLYENILPSSPTLASEHALRQEEQTYKNSTKLTYRNVCSHGPPCLPCLIPIPGGHKFNRFPEETPYPHFHLPSFCRHR